MSLALKEEHGFKMFEKGAGYTVWTKDYIWKVKITA
jgi:hypothetical protein